MFSRRYVFPFSVPTMEISLEVFQGAPSEEDSATPIIAFVRSGTPQNDAYREAFVQGMRERGYIEGRNVPLFRGYRDRTTIAYGGRCAPPTVGHRHWRWNSGSSG